ncbi:uncharacterized protein LOC131330452 isoform X2 [Rhododendron vialii]|nr:uncharacterized protein LOC131330452 isoform X2 [Rhododendron vialii]XP_058220020.1 uncharacterized protein LOC131330452 isoform X2 [Rhododendron vialii]
MEADVVVKHQAMNPCCAALKEKYIKLGEKRNVLRQAVKMQNDEIDKLQNENLSLMKENEEGRVQAAIERQENAKESDRRISLENEVRALKSEILSLQQKGSSESQDLDGEVMLLRTRISAGETEINRLKELLEKERITAESGCKKAEAEKKEAEKAWKIVEEEKSRANEERRLADIERKKLDENGVQLEKLKVEAKKNLEIERQKVMQEKKRADSEMAKAEEQKNLAEMNQKKAIDEKCRANDLSQQLQEYKQRLEKLKKEMDEQESSKTFVKLSTDLSDKEMKPDATGRGGLFPLEMLKPEMAESKLVSGDLTSETVKKSIKQQKQKAVREKRRADSEMRKAEEQRVIAEANMKKAMEEKRRADQLAQQLEDKGRKIEGLQIEMLEFASSRKLVEAPVDPPNIHTNSETAKMKLLKDELKFKKKQLKHAKEVAKLEIGRNKILQQELHLLKKECVQFSHRLDLLNKCFPYCCEGRDDNAKNGNIFNIPSFNLKKKLFMKESHQVHLHCNNDLDASDFMKQSIDSNAQLLPCSVRNCAQCTSGIDSKMEPLLGGSNRQMLQSSALNSSTSSFSDGLLMGSQERGAFSVTASAIVAGEKSKSKSQSNISSLSGEVTRTRCIDAVGRKAGHGKKRKRIVNALKSIEHLYSEGKNLQLRIEEKLSMLHGMLNSQTGKFLQKNPCMMSDLECNPIALPARVHKKRKASCEEVALKHLSDLNGCTDIQRGEVQAFDAVMGDWGNLGSHEELEGNYMKLLDLHNAVDEDRYRKAIQLPLSPTLPVIAVQNNESFELDNTRGYAVDEDRYRKFELNESFEQANLGPICKVDVNTDAESDRWKFGTSKTSHVPPLNKNGGIANPFENVTNNGNVKCNTVYEDNTCPHQMERSHAERGMPDIYSCGYGGANNLCQSSLVRAGNDIRRCYVVVSDTKDYSSMSRIFCAAGTCMSEFSTISQTDLVQKLLHALSSNEDLSKKEKACVYFSVLLNKISGIAMEEFRNFLKSGSIRFFESFAGHMHTAVSDMQTRCILAELCTSGELLTLIEDFLMNRRILVYSDVSSHSLPLCGSMDDLFLNGKEEHLSYETALTPQLLAGSILLAALCAAIDHIGFLCEASYNIFRMHELDGSLVLTILHVFAFVCGSKYFNHKDDGLIMTVIKSLVPFLEKRNIASDSDSCPEFPACTQCPFSVDVVSVETVVLSLLQQLQKYALSGTVNQDPNEVENSSSLLSYNEKAENTWWLEGELNLQPMNCSASCCLIKLDMPTSQVKSLCDGNFCHFSDVISLVELVAGNMSWDWTCNNIVHQLLRLLESCAQENFFAVTVILLGKLGRLGVDASGYEDNSVENLRYRLSSFLCQSSSRKLSRLSQIAIVNALLGLLSISFTELIKSTVEVPAVVSPPNDNPTDCIREWYSGLSKELQSLSFSLLQSASVSCCTTS